MEEDEDEKGFVKLLSKKNKRIIVRGKCRIKVKISTKINKINKSTKPDLLSLIPEKFLFEEYKDEAFQFPSTPEEWRTVANRFGTRWNFEHCLGALDGKHIAIKKPKKSGSTYYNFKGFYSIVLMAAVDADYRFLWCSVGYPGSSSDAGIFQRSRLRRALERGTLGVPPDEPLPGDDRHIPYFFVGDDAFPLRQWLMKPFPLRFLTPGQRIFNYHLSRARRIVENAFGILANRWRCLLTNMAQEPRNTIKIVLGCVTLHNVVRRRHPHLQPHEVDREDADGNVRRGHWRRGQVLTDNRNLVGNQAQRAAKQTRNYLSDYYNSPTFALPWQDRIVRPRRVEPRHETD